MDDRRVKRRIDTWRDRLLDLSLRNRQLNYVFNKSTLKVSPSDHLFTLGELLQDKHLAIVSSAVWDEDCTSDETLSSRQRIKLSRTLIADCSLERLSKTYIKLYRESEKLELERGYRSLYLSVGFISWYESETSEVERFCPVILIPVKLARQSRGSTDFSVIISADDDPLCLNEAMLRKFEIDFGISMPSSFSTEELLNFEEPIEEEDPRSSLSDESDELSLVDVVERYLDAVEKTLQNHKSSLKRWSLQRELWGMNLLDFAKGVMWRDLSSLLDVKDSPIISQLLSGGEGISPMCHVTPVE